MKTKYLLFAAAFMFLFNHVKAQNNAVLQDLNKQKLEVLLKEHKNIQFVKSDNGRIKFYEAPQAKVAASSQLIKKSDAAGAANFHLTKDINVQTDANPSNTSIENINSNDASYAILNNVMYFSANDGIHGNELWRSDGTAPGTYMVKDIIPGAASSNPVEIVASGNKIVFIAASATTYYYALCASDGTAGGTTVLKDYITQGAGVNDLHYLTNVAGTVYFFLNYSPQLWKTDGTVAGTFLVKDFYNLAQSPFLVVAFNGLLYFTLYTDESGRELWRSDGIDAGTFMVKDISSNNDFFGGPFQLTPFNNKLYFTEDEFVGSGRKLWFTDGTAAGTMPAGGQNNVLMSDYFLFSLFNTPFAVKNNSFFTNASTTETGMELFKYNTSKGFVLVKDITPGNAGGEFFYFSKTNDLIAFVYYDTIHKKNELWGTFGSAATTKLIKLDSASGIAFFSNLVEGNNNLLYFTYSSTDGTELWRTNGLPGSTFMVKDIYAGPTSSNPSCLTLLKGKMYFRAASKKAGTELWQTNGTKEGTTMLPEINTVATNYSAPDYYSYSGSNIQHGVALNKTVYFSATTPETGYELYKSDGTTTGTMLASDIVSGESSSSPQAFLNKNHAAYFTSFGNYSGISKIDSAGNIQKLISAAGAIISYDVADNGTVFYIFNNYLTGKPELWRVTDAGGDAVFLTGKVINTNYPYAIKVIGNKAYFTAADENGTELWISDGTVAGTKMVKDLYAGSNSSNPASLYPYNGNIYFGAYDGSRYALWKSNGTATGTVRVKNITPYGVSGYQPNYEDFFCVVNGILYFNASTDNKGAELWRTNGTTAGTVLVKDIYAGSEGSNPSLLTNVNGTLFFAISINDELWRSDGTTNGTVLVKSLAASNTYLFNERCVADNKFFFNTGNLLWVSDGTDAGTHLVADNGLNGVSNIRNMVAADNNVFFNGTSDKYNAELYVGDATKVMTSALAKSNTIETITESSFNAAIIQNPVISQLKLQLQSASEQTLNIVISNQRGHVMAQKTLQSVKGNIQFSIDAANWQTGIYLIKISNAKGETISLKALK